ncbi:hypothetical protein [Rhodopirellula baltica]|uniref:hypothetical protein n=1 Tax=Rhodopirellula baltica TaxID=265606 RepID=UPI00055EEC19|nr:hypothetical protein [Rhodopirellula baltica]
MKRGQTIADAKRDLARQLRDTTGEVSLKTLLERWQHRWSRELGPEQDEDLFLLEEIAIAGGQFQECLSNGDSPRRSNDSTSLSSWISGALVFAAAFSMALLFWHVETSLFIAALIGCVALILYRLQQFRRQHWRSYVLINASLLLITCGTSSIAISLFSGDQETVHVMGIAFNANQPAWLSCTLCLAGLAGVCFAVTRVEPEK